MQGQPASTQHRLTAAWSAPSDVRAGTSCKCNGSSGGLARRSTKVEERRTRTARAPPAHRPRTARAHRPRTALPAERVFDHRRRYRGTTSRRRGSQRFPRVALARPRTAPPAGSTGRRARAQGCGFKIETLFCGYDLSYGKLRYTKRGVVTPGVETGKQVLRQVLRQLPKRNSTARLQTQREYESPVQSVTSTVVSPPVAASPFRTPIDQYEV